MSEAVPMAGARDVAFLEREIFSRTAGQGTACAVFVLGSPRTGSTFLYQALVSVFRLPYIDNLTNEFFAATPIVGLLVASSLRAGEAITFSSRYGKSQGLVQPSEGSRVMANWFGGGHPSQLVASRIVDGREPHLKATLGAVQALLGGPLVIKNAWNCFRTEYLAKALPQANFVWIRRDIRAAAKSDLLARYKVQGDPRTWNSATPANVELLRQRHYCEQVVENQFEFGQAISRTMREIAPGRFVELWYEDMVANPARILSQLGSALSLLRRRDQQVPGAWGSGDEPGEGLASEEAAAIDAYVASNERRFTGYLRA